MLIIGAAALAGCVSNSTSITFRIEKGYMTVQDSVYVRYADSTVTKAVYQGTAPNLTHDDYLVNNATNKTIVSGFVTNGTVSWAPDNIQNDICRCYVIYNHDNRKLYDDWGKPTIPAVSAEVQSVSANAANAQHVDVTFAVYGAQHQLVDGLTEIFAHTNNPDVKFEINNSPSLAYESGYSKSASGGLVTFTLAPDPLNASAAQLEIANLDSFQISLKSGFKDIPINHEATAISVSDKTISTPNGITLHGNDLASDADTGDQLKIGSASAQTPGVVNLTVNNGELRIIPQSVGSTNITAVVYDTYSASARVTFNVIVEASAIPRPSGSTDPDIGPVTSAQADVSPTTGAEVKLKDRIRVTVPAGAVSAKGTVKVALVPDNQAPVANGQQALSPTFELTSTTGRTFAKPVELTFTYDAGHVVNGLRGAVYYYDEQQQRWIFIGRTQNSDGTITAYVNHFTKFAVFVYEPKMFSDMAGHWAAIYTDRLIGMKVTSGYPDHTFRPEEKVTRVQFTKMFVEALGLPISDSAITFSDNSAIPVWAKSAVVAAVKAGYIHGYEENSATLFKPDQTITRSEMAVLIAKALQTEVAPAASKAIRFKDETDIPVWAKPSVAAAVSAGILNGFEDGTFRSNNAATRAEAAAMIYKLLEALHI
ncbi:S-layer homology domain-containing protein [Paenibacillus andongensis]|uniref:S-layer homology domain-containing protein n=1 Tax=Paenibacillus andongensis TaxID=2975482 RepID=UPI0021BA434D|nr:S-layer homology domain-containing protein [Paenibacillus andongensis]